MTPIKSSDKKALNEAFAVKVAGWQRTCTGKAWWTGEGTFVSYVADFTDDANAVLPWLEKLERWVCEFGTERKPIWCIYSPSPRFSNGEAEAPTFPHAAVIALLRAHGVEVVP